MIVSMQFKRTNNNKKTAIPCMNHMSGSLKNILLLMKCIKHDFN